MSITFAHGKSRIANPFATSTRAPEASPTTIQLLRRPPLTLFSSSAGDTRSSTLSI